MSMSNEVEVPYGDTPAQTAQNLLAAAERLDLEPFVVATTTRGVFLVPEEVAAEAEAYAERDDDETPVADKPLAEYTKAELDKLAEDEEIDLTGAKRSNLTKVARIEEVRAQRMAEAEVEANAKADSTDEPPNDDDTTTGADKSDETQE